MIFVLLLTSHHHLLAVKQRHCPRVFRYRQLRHPQNADRLLSLSSRWNFTFCRSSRRFLISNGNPLVLATPLLSLVFSFFFFFFQIYLDVSPSCHAHFEYFHIDIKPLISLVHVFLPFFLPFEKEKRHMTGFIFFSLLRLMWVGPVPSRPLGLKQRKPFQPNPYSVCLHHLIWTSTFIDILVYQILSKRSSLHPALVKHFQCHLWLFVSFRPRHFTLKILHFFLLFITLKKKKENEICIIS